MEKDEHWADDDSSYGLEDFIWLCDYFNDNTGDEKNNNGNTDGGCGLFEGDDEWENRENHWRGARKIMKTYLKREKLNSAGDVCVWIMRKSEFGSMSVVVKLAFFLTLVPPTSVPVERGFSIRNLIKTLLKNRMKVDLMNALMLVNYEINSKLEKFIARRAAEI
jgi:hypothetical protein